MTAATVREVLGEVPPETPEPSSQAQADARARESSVTGGPDFPAEGSPESVTESSRWARLAGFPEKAQAKLTAVATGASPWRTPPLALDKLHEHHRVSATHFADGLWPWLRWPRHAWGGLHIVLAMLLYALIWAWRSPAGFAVSIVGGFIVWHYI